MLINMREYAKKVISYNGIKNFKNNFAVYAIKNNHLDFLVISAILFTASVVKNLI